MNKLIVCYMIENDDDVFELSYNSIKDVADEIVIIDGNQYSLTNGSPATIEKPKYCWVNSINKNATILLSPYPHSYKGADGKQRNEYLEYIKQHFKDDWCLVVDADEVIEYPEQIKPTIEYLEKNNIDCASIRMRHLINNFGQEDSTLEKHYVPCRLFKITDKLKYPEVEHNVLQGWLKCAQVDSFINWHLGYCREVFRLKKKYLNHCEKSNIHNAHFLEWWYHAHLFGEYPIKKVNHEELPKIIKEYFNVNDDYLYFRNRGVELKHAEMVKQWNEYFKPESVFDVGCGRGPYLRYWEMITKNVAGCELSRWAIDNKLCDCGIYNCDVFDLNSNTEFELVTVIDVLEHLNIENLSKSLRNIYESGERFLFSIPFIGDPNLELDKTHIIKKSKEWWLEQLNKTGFKIEPTPDNFYYKEQIIIAKK